MARMIYKTLWGKTNETKNLVTYLLIYQLHLMLSDTNFLRHEETLW